MQLPTLTAPTPVAVPPRLRVADLPDRFFIDLAVGTSTFDDLCTTYGLDPERVREHAEDTRFIQRTLLAKQAVDEDGRAFKARCRTVAHEALPRMLRIINDPDTPAPAAVEAFKTVAKFGELEPKPAAQNQGGGNIVNFTIVAPTGERVVYSGENLIQSSDKGAVVDLSDMAWIEQ